MTGTDPGASFSGTVRFIPDAVGVRLEAPATMSPRLPAETVGGVAIPEVPARTATVSAKAVDSLCPAIALPGERLEMEIRYVPQSGGHTHQTSAVLSATELGRILSAVAPNAGTTFAPSTGSLSGVGAIGASVTAGEVSCDLSWRATAVSSGATAEKMTAVDPGLGLVDIAAIPVTIAPSFVLTGSPRTPPCANTAACAGHERNHFVRSAFGRTLHTLADLVLDYTGGRFKVGLDDMSLERGGVFDLGGDYLPPHHLHRRGTDVDIVFAFDLVTGTDVAASVLIREIRRAALWTHLRRVPERPIHYRFGG